LAAGLPVSATPDAARTLHNNPSRVDAMGVKISDEAPAGSMAVELQDVDLETLADALEPFGVTIPELVAIAVQDHGYEPGVGNSGVRFAYLQSLVEEGGDLARTVFQSPPRGMTRMAAVRSSVPGAYLMDTGAAAVLGALGDPLVSTAVHDSGA